MEAEAAANCLSANPDYRVLRRVAIADEHVFAENVADEPVGRLAVVDTETTGFKVEEGDRIIDLPLRFVSTAGIRASSIALWIAIRA